MLLIDFFIFNVTCLVIRRKPEVFKILSQMLKALTLCEELRTKLS